MHGNALRAARKKVSERQPSDFSTGAVSHLPITSDKITGFYRIDRIFLILNPVNHDNPVILSKKHESYPHLHSRAQRGWRAKQAVYILAQRRREAENAEENANLERYRISCLVTL